MQWQFQPERRVRTCERNSSTDTRVSAGRSQSMGKQLFQKVPQLPALSAQWWTYTPPVHRAEGNFGANVKGKVSSLPKSEVGGVKTKAAARKTNEPVER